GGTGSSVPYSQAYGAEHSFSSQAEADSKGLSKFNTEGQAYANANGYCTFRSIALSGSFTKNNCPVGGVGSSVFFSQVAGAKTSTDSQADADAKGLELFNTNGLNNANANGYCTFTSNAKSGVFTRNNCAAGGTPQSVTYDVPAGRYSSNVSQEAADTQAQNDINANGQAYANDNNNAKCIFWNTAQSRLITRNNCSSGGTPESVWYTVPAGTHGSYYSQEAADNRALDQINRYGQDYANSAGKCT
ncbi:DUF5977 domain-containing protein, partial [Flavobacterium collinsii]|uniref:DUF5977 domain-containing protein n=1 Tax=Flavobacterium collinsii TaxID=1114861 RepID=UPI00248F85AD